MPHLHSYKTTRQGHGRCDCGQSDIQHCCADYFRNREIEYIAYDAWLPNLRILVPHVPDNILLDYIRRACITFAQDSAALRRNIKIETQSCVADYYPCLGDQERIEAVRQLSVGGRCYNPIGDTCAWQIGGNQYWFYPPCSLEIHPAPRTCQLILLIVKAMPREDSDHVDRLLHDRFFAAILGHAASNAMLAPADDQSGEAPKSIGNLRQVYIEDYQRGVHQSKNEQYRHFSTGLVS